MSREGWNLGMALGEYAADQQRRYTLDEAKRELARRECDMQGHYYEVVVGMGENKPAFVLCSRCGERWEMSPTGGAEASG